MEDVIIQILCALFEVILEAIVYLPFDWPQGDFRDSGGKITVAGWILICFGIGCTIGITVNWLHPGTFLRSPTLRMLNVVLGPFLSGFSAYVIAKHRLKKDHRVKPSRHFFYAGALTFGLIIIRFTGALR